MGLYEMLFGNLPPRPARPTSRGAMLGAGGYQDMPDSPNLDDRRQDDPYAQFMRQNQGITRAGLEEHPMSPLGGAPLGPAYSPDAPPDMPVYTSSGGDPMLYAGAGDIDPGSYSPSFQQNWRPPPSGQAPYRPSFGPHPDRGPVYDPAWVQGITPGMAGWQTPPSPSGPHNRGGDPARPGWDRIFPSFPAGMTLNSVPQ